MKPRFEPDIESGDGAQSGKVLIDPEAFDASEQRFAASLEEKQERPKPRFVVEAEPATAEEQNPTAANECESTEAPKVEESRPAEPAQQLSQPDPIVPPADPDSWRREIASKVSHYRSRRRVAAPRYPSLQLKFESPEPCEPATQPSPTPTSAPNRTAVASQPELQPHDEMKATSESQPSSVAPEAGAKILEFPRPLAPPPPRLDELADPVFDTPRILEAPELLPPPPALGGILIEPVEEPSQERRPGFELPLRAAPMSQRIIAWMTDAVLVLMSFALFAYTFFRMTGTVPPLRLAAGVSVALIFIFWAAYRYSMLVYSGSTPGLKLAKLRPSRFDGGPVPRRIRRWRVIASILSGLSLGLGYAWCFLDEDELCWHDRITRTYMAPKTPE